MPDDLRSKIICLAFTMPEKSSERKALLDVLAEADVRKTASPGGPSPTGSNWKEKTISNVTHWVWVNPDDEHDIVKMTVIEGDKAMIKSRGGPAFWLTVQTADGSLYSSQIVGNETLLFKLGVELYESGRDPSTLSGWRKI